MSVAQVVEPRAWLMPAKSHVSMLLQGAGVSFAVLVLGTATGFALQLLLARLLGVAEYGTYVYALTWINVLVVFSKLGQEASLLRFVAAYKATQDWALLRGCLAHSARLVLLTSGCIAASAATIVWVLRDHIGASQVETFWLALLLLPVMAMVGLRQSALRALTHVAKAALPDSVLRHVLLAVMVLAAWCIVPAATTAPTVMWMNLTATIIALAIGTFWLVRALPVNPDRTKSNIAQREWRRVSFPLFMISGLYLILGQADVAMLGMLRDVEQAGIYATASRVANLAIFGLLAANTIVAPMISELFHTGQRHALQRVVTYAARGVFVFVLVSGGCLAIAGRFCLSLFGPEFALAYVPLLILILGHVFNSLGGSVGFLMTMTGRERPAAWIIGTATVVNVLLNLWLIPRFGMIGAASATALTTALWNSAMGVYVWRNLRINPTILGRV